MGAESLVVVIFHNEEDAMSAEHQFHNMSDRGDITLGNIILIRKKKGGEFENLKIEHNGMGQDTFVGFAIGSIATMFFGPILFLAGSLVGTGIGALVGHESSKIDKDFVEKVKGEIKEGDIALIANCQEHSSTVLDDTMKNYNDVKLYRTTA